MQKIYHDIFASVLTARFILKIRVVSEIKIFPLRYSLTPSFSTNPSIQATVTLPARCYQVADKKQRIRSFLNSYAQRMEIKQKGRKDRSYYQMVYILNT